MSSTLQALCRRLLVPFVLALVATTATTATTAGTATTATAADAATTRPTPGDWRWWTNTDCDPEAEECVGTSDMLVFQVTARHRVKVLSAYLRCGEESIFMPLRKGVGPAAISKRGVARVRHSEKLDGERYTLQVRVKFLTRKSARGRYRITGGPCGDGVTMRFTAARLEYAHTGRS